MQHLKITTQTPLLLLSDAFFHSTSVPLAVYITHHLGNTKMLPIFSSRMVLLGSKLHICTYHSLPKTSPWAEHLTSLPKRGGGRSFDSSHLTTKECPHHVYSDSKAGLKPSKQIIGHKITYSRIASCFEVES